jgi:hypothetical protein
MDAQIFESSMACFGTTSLQPIEGITIFFFDNFAPYYPRQDANLQATVYVMVDGKLVGTYRGSTYPSGPLYSTIEEGEHKFNNAFGHGGGTPSERQGLNIVDNVIEGNEYAPRTTLGSHPSAPGFSVVMENVNIHSFRRESQGCPTILESQWSSFASHFDWSGSSGHTGNSSGTVYIFRNKSGNVVADK